MSSVLIQSLLLASSGLLSVGSITLVILLLISDRGWHNGLGYALGYTCSYTLIGISVLLLRYNAAEEGEPSIIIPVVSIILGSLLLFISFRNLRKPVSEEKKENRFFSIVNNITPVKAFGFGALVTVINFKNLALFLAALSVVILSDLPISEKILITLLVVLVFCMSVIVPVVLYIIFPNRGKDLLGGIKESLDRHSRSISIWAPIVFGLIFITRGIIELL